MTELGDRLGPSKDERLAALYRLTREFDPGQPAWRQLIGVIGREARHWWSRPDEQVIVEAEINADIRLFVDLRDRYGFDLANGLITEATDFALFSNMARDAAEIFDIGANVGLYAVAAGRGLAAGQGLVAGQGRAFTFEPNPPTFDLLKRNIETNGLASRVTPYPFALSDKREQRSFHACRDAAFSGLHPTDRSPEVRLLELETRRLDDIWREEGARPIDLLKIDVEGHEQAVLAGSQEALAASPDLVIQMEVSQKNHQTGAAELMPAWFKAFFDEAFTVHAFDDVLKETIIDGDDPEQPLDGNLFLCRREGRALSRLRAAAESERQARAGASTTSPAAAGIEVLLTLIEQHRDEIKSLKTVKSKVEHRCQELADKVQGRNLVVAKLKARIEDLTAEDQKPVAMRQRA